MRDASSSWRTSRWPVRSRPGSLGSAGQPPERSSGPSPLPRGRIQTRPRSTPSRRSRSARCPGLPAYGDGGAGRPKATRTLLLIVYLAALSVGNHLLALLAGPAVVVFLAMTIRGDANTDRDARRREWGEVAVVAGMWALLVGTGLGSTTLVLLGAVAFAVSAGFATSAGAGGFAVASLALAVVGVSPYLFLYLRSAQHPLLNEAAPDTFRRAARGHSPCAISAAYASRRSDHHFRTRQPRPVVPASRYPAARLPRVLRLAVGPFGRDPVGGFPAAYAGDTWPSRRSVSRAPRFSGAPTVPGGGCCS